MFCLKYLISSIYYLLDPVLMPPAEVENSYHFEVSKSMILSADRLSAKPQALFEGIDK